MFVARRKGVNANVEPGTGCDLHFFGGIRPEFRGWGSYLSGLVSISLLYGFAHQNKDNTFSR